MPIYTFTFILMMVCVIFYYRAGEIEGSSGAAWAFMSLVISLILWRLLRSGFIAVLLGQFALFAAITLYRSHKSQGR